MGDTRNQLISTAVLIPENRWNSPRLLHKCAAAQRSESAANTAVIRQLFNHQESEKRQCLAGLCTSISGRLEAYAIARKMSLARIPQHGSPPREHKLVLRPGRGLAMHFCYRQVFIRGIPVPTSEVLAMPDEVILQSIVFRRRAVRPAASRKTTEEKRSQTCKRRGYHQPFRKISDPPNAKTDPSREAKRKGQRCPSLVE